jgi:hypothetical protein
MYNKNKIHKQTVGAIIIVGAHRAQAYHAARVYKQNKIPPQFDKFALNNRLKTKYV